MARQVVLNAVERPVHLNSSSVYFTFADGRLHYDCEACGAQCCRGHGYELQAGLELETHLSSSASVRFFLDPSSASAENHYHVANWKPGCFFLTDAGKCRIQLEHGYGSKPGTCRLFPFNRFLRVGEHLIVSPHPGLCPLEVMPPDRKSACSRHGALLTSMTQTAINLHVPEAPRLEYPPAVMVALERRIVELSERHLTDEAYSRFAAAQLLATREALRSMTPEHATIAAARDDVSHFCRSLHRILGTRPSSAASAAQSLIATMVAATPTFRAEILFGPNAGEGEAPLEVDQLPYALVALEALARLAADAGMQRVTYQSLAALLKRYRPLIALLARLDSVMIWSATATAKAARSSNDTPFQTLCTIMRASLPDPQLRARTPLVDLLDSVLPRSHDLARVMLLKSLARDLIGKLVPVERYRGPTLFQLVKNPRSTVQQWVVAKVSDEMLTAIARRSGRRSHSAKS